MSINITDRSLGIWFVEMQWGDWMGHIESLPDGNYQLTYRFRREVDDRIFNSNDQKDWWSGVGPDLDAGINAVRDMADFLHKHHGLQKWELLRGAGSVQQFFEELRKLPFAHSRETIKPEAIPNAPKDPTDGQSHCENGKYYIWIAQHQGWVAE